MAAITNWDSLSIEALEAQLQEISAQREKLSAIALEIHAVLDKKIHLKRATEQLGPDALKALGLEHTVSDAGAIDSAETLGKPS